MIAFAIIGSMFCLLLGIDKICNRLDRINNTLGEKNEK